MENLEMNCRYWSRARDTSYTEAETSENKLFISLGNAHTVRRTEKKSKSKTTHTHTRSPDKIAIYAEFLME